MDTRKKLRPNRHPQAGAALITALILLLVLTVIGVTSLANTVMEERMAGNMRERQIAFQASEAALREGERLIDSRDDIHEVVFYNNGADDSNRTANNDGDVCRNGFCIPQQRDEDYDADDTLTCNGVTRPTVAERWALPDGCSGNLDVWNTSGRHRVYELTDEIDPGPGIPDPKYIIEFIAYSPAPGGTSNCDTNGDGVNETPAGTDEWPYCPSDPQLYRITALGFAGGGNTRVMLQETYLKAD